MLSALVHFALRYRAVVVVVAAVLMAVGVWDSLRSPLDVLLLLSAPAAAA